MIKIYAVFMLALLFYWEPLHAQDTCKSYSHNNPHGSPMTISRVWILDSVNFRVESIPMLPYQEAANGTYDFKVCILARDGKKYSTQVRYMTTHGAVSYPISNFQAPGGASGVSREGTSLSYSISPNPTRSNFTILGAAGSKWVIYDMGGVEVLSGVTAAVSESVDVTSLASGSYFLKITSTTGFEESQKLIIQ